VEQAPSATLPFPPHLSALNPAARRRQLPLVTVHTVRSLADHVGGAIIGDGAESVITGISDLRSARPDQVSFLANAKYEPDARASRAAAILVSPKDAPRFSFTRIVVESPSAAFGKISALFAPAPIRDEPGIHPSAVVAPDAVIGEGVSIQAHAVIAAGVRIGARTVVGANCFIGGQTTIGDDTRLYPLVTVRERSVIGARVIIHSGAVIGSDGFGYNFDPKTGRHVKIAHTGHVQIDDDAEIGANTTIDRGRFGKTHIGEGVKIDNLVQIAHNARLGDHVVMAGQSGVGGSSSVGNRVSIGGQVAVADHFSVGDDVILAGRTGVMSDITEPGTYFGVPARPLGEAMRTLTLYTKLSDLFKRVKDLEKRADSKEPKQL
jgi:UDP-3-O-[3-hydroxymyristoyl] glucosamine N-acyltransferase